MIFYILFKGIILGFAIAAVVGPISILCLRRAIAEGFWAGIFSGFGVVLADALYASIAVFGLTAISDFFIKKVFFLSLIGGTYLVYIGYKAISKKPQLANNKLEKSSLLHMFISTFFLTMTNPMTILSFMIIFAGLNIASGNLFANVSLILGVAIGSLFWWVLLVSLGSILKYKLTSIKVLMWINRISGIIIGGFGLIIILRSLIS